MKFGDLHRVLLVCSVVASHTVCGEDPSQQNRDIPTLRLTKLARPKVPEIPERPNLHPIDAFVLGKLRTLDLQAGPLADKPTLVRRAYFDLVGLPPPPEKVAAFTQDEDSSGWSKLIDELLKSPHYGERWGRHWLDVARYADSGGYETDIYYRNAWRYRDYVVKSFNDDKPYNRFVCEQVAGDELWPDNLDLDPKRVYILSDDKRQHLEARIGTGLYGLGPQVHESGLDAVKLRYEQLTDWVDTTGSMFLGLTMGCARCHDHKFDPITQRDYFAMQAIFASSVEQEVPLLTAMEVADWKQHYPRIVAVDEAKRAFRLFEKRVSGRELTPELQQEKRQLLESIAQAVLQIPERAGSVPNSPFDAMMGVPTATVLGHERLELIKSVHLLDRGELSRSGDRISPGLPVALAAATHCDPAISGPFNCRRQLATWLTGPDHPLTARVFVNRIWQWHFGRGIVATSNDFGKMGVPPSHSELLDWLAAEFVAQGWSVKALHRLIMTSEAYRRSSRFASAAHLAKDAENVYLWRMNRRRLEAESLWDAVHSAAGTLNLATGGRPVVPQLAADEIAALRERWHWPTSADPADHMRRGMYILVRRNFRFPMFEVFDAPVTSVSCPARDTTTVTPQALWSLNNPTVHKQAEALAQRIRKEASSERPIDWINRLWTITLSRSPSDIEREEAIRFLADSEQAGQTAALTSLCLAMFNLNEFAFVD